MAKKDLTQKEFLQQLGEYADTLRRTIEANCAAFPVDAKASKARRKRAQGGFKFFCATYFPHYTQVGGKPTGPSALHVPAQRLALPLSGRHLVGAWF